MKNFEKYLDEIAEAMQMHNCIIPVKCPYYGIDCAECFKRWAVDEVVE